MLRGLNGCAFVMTMAVASQAEEFRANDLLVSVSGFSQIVTRTRLATTPEAAVGANPIVAIQPGPLAFGPEGDLYAIVGDSVRAFDRSGNVTLDLGVGVTGLSGLAFGAGGELFVVSSTHASITRIRSMAGQSSVEDSFAVPGDSLRGLAMGPQGTLFVGARGRIIELSTVGIVLRETALPDPEDLPGALTFGRGGHLYVGMRVAHTWDGGVFGNRIYEYADGLHVQTLGDNTQLDQVSAIAIGPDDAIYVTSWQSQRLHAFDPSTLEEVWTMGLPPGAFPTGLAIAPQRLEGKLVGSFTTATTPAAKLAERVIVSVTPGSHTVMIEFPDLAKSNQGFDDRFGQEALVFHGYDARGGALAPKKRTYGGIELGDVDAGTATMSAQAAGKLDAVGAFRIKSIIGTIGRHGEAGGWHATLKAAKRLN
ncbi:MAG: hypothetical protein IPH13_01670 [Planctomycetes bacterium]|nr:hypothetical protein [Planctomycetota bacterium]